MTATMWQKEVKTMRKQMEEMHRVLDIFEMALLSYKRLLEGSVAPEGEHLALLVDNIYENVMNLGESITDFEEAMDELK